MNLQEKLIFMLSKRQSIVILPRFSPAEVVFRNGEKFIIDGRYVGMDENTYQFSISDIKKIENGKGDSSHSIDEILEAMRVRAETWNVKLKIIYDK